MLTKLTAYDTREPVYVDIDHATSIRGLPALPADEHGGTMVKRTNIQMDDGTNVLVAETPDEIMSPEDQS